MTIKELDELLSDHQLWLSGNGGSRADLSQANLSRADLSRADLFEADLFGATYNLLDILQLNIPVTSNKLVLELMRWDATVCGEKLMNNWARGGEYPFSGNIKRLFNFNESRRIWKQGKPNTTLLKPWNWIAKENKIKL